MKHIFNTLKRLDDNIHYNGADDDYLDILLTHKGCLYNLSFTKLDCMLSGDFYVIEMDDGGFDFYYSEINLQSISEPEFDNCMVELLHNIKQSIDLYDKYGVSNK